jgi:hypothetical protein
MLLYIKYYVATIDQENREVQTTVVSPKFGAYTGVSGTMMDFDLTAPSKNHVTTQCVGFSGAPSNDIFRDDLPVSEQPRAC